MKQHILSSTFSFQFFAKSDLNWILVLCQFNRDKSIPEVYRELWCKEGVTMTREDPFHTDMSLEDSVCHERA